ncbi:MAG: hypothetical protein AAB467_02870 [Patescibacteria group bacterium]
MFCMVQDEGGATIREKHMPRTKQKSEFVSGLGSAFEFVKAISDEVRKQGGNDDDLRKVIAQEVLRKTIAKAIVGRDGNQFPSLALAAELIPTGWTVIEDVAPSAFDISKLKPRSFLTAADTKGWITGEEMRKRAPELGGNLGLSDAPRLLADGGKAIPVKFRGYYIPLPGTKLRDSGGRLCVPCLGWGGERWYLDFVWLGRGWGGGGRLACSE